MANYVILSKADEKFTVNKDFNIIFFRLTKEQLNSIKEELSKISISRGNNQDELKLKFKKRHRFDLEDIIAYGDTNIKKEMAEKLIPKRTLGTWFLKMYKDHSRLETTYKCYKSERWDYLHGFITTTIHPEAISGWACAMDVCNNAPYGIILSLAPNKDITLINFRDE